MRIGSLWVLVVRGRATLIGVLLLVAAPFCFASSYLDQGETALRNNEPDRAKALFQASLNANPGDERAMLYLGVAEIQLGELSKAADTFKQGLGTSTSLKDLFYYNIGNVYFMQNQNTLADGMYSQAIVTNPNLADAYLNRANARMRLQNYSGATSDYKVYLSLKPDAPQRPQIEKVLSLLQDAKAQAEQNAKLAAEKKKQEEARQKALLNDVLQSLNNASSNTKNLQAGNASIQESKPTFGLDN